MISTRIVQAAGIAVALFGLAFVRQPAPVADPTFADDVAPILYKNCAACHHTGGLAPFSVVDYDSIVPNLDDMRDAVSNGQMPPWHAAEPPGVFRNDRRLSDADKQTILHWIDAGAKPGDSTHLPPRPTFTSEWTIGTPDAVVGMAEDFTVPASGTVEYQYFEVPTNFTEDKWVQAIEVLPGAHEVVHHVLVYARVPATPGARPPAPAPRPAGTPAPAPLFIRNRAQGTPPEPPRLDTLHPPPRQMGNLVASLAPGMSALVLPKGAAMRFRAGTVLTFQMHYTAHGQAMKDRTRIGFKFADAPPQQEIFASAFYNGQFTIPAGAKDVSVPSELTAGQPVRIWGLLPHTHLRGTRWKYTLEKPDGTSEVILDVPHYDFNWQTYYLFTTPLDLQPGAKIAATAWYDNSTANEHNPDATKDVHWGDQTWEEMQYTGFLYSIPGRQP